MTQPPEYGSDDATTPLGAVPPAPDAVPPANPTNADAATGAVPPPPPPPAQKSGSNTRTIIEIVAGVVALIAILGAAIFGFALGHWSGRKSVERDRPSMSFRFDGGGPNSGGPALPGWGFDGDRGSDDGGQPAPDGMPNLDDFYERFGDGNGGYAVPEELQDLLEGLTGGGDSSELSEDLQDLLEGLGVESGTGFGPLPAPPAPTGEAPTS